MIDPPPSQIWYCYGEFQSLFRQYPRVKFHEGLPDVSRFDGRQSVLLIIDDFMQETDANLFTKGSHHRNISVIYLTQNLFHKNPHMRAITLNSHYMIWFKNPTDAGQFAILARQMYPSNWKFAVEAYRNATEKSFGYILVDLKPQQEENLRLRSNFFRVKISMSTLANYKFSEWE